jgi:hypothetical protein
VTLVSGDELSVSRCEFFGGDHCCGAPAEQFGAIRPKLGSELVESCDEFVVELDENFTAGHGHMLSPMVVATELP